MSRCRHLKGADLIRVIEKCVHLRDLRVSEVEGLNDQNFARALFRTNRLQRLEVSGCANFSNAALKAIMHGTDPDIDIGHGVPIVPVRRLRHLDMSECPRLTSQGIRAMAHLVPDLEALVLSDCPRIGSDSLQDVLATTPNLAFLELARLPLVSNELLCSLAKAPCAPKLRHVDLGSCTIITDVGVLPLIRACVSIESLRLDNTRVTNFALIEAVDMVRQRPGRPLDGNQGHVRARVGLHLVVYDSEGITVAGIRDIVYHNTLCHCQSDSGEYLLDLISLECEYKHQQLVSEHIRRLLSGNFDGAARLAARWDEFLDFKTHSTNMVARRRSWRRRHRPRAWTEQNICEVM